MHFALSGDGADKGEKDFCLCLGGFGRIIMGNAVVMRRNGPREDVCGGKELRMEQQEMLFEQYEDALFAMWMEPVARAEGRRLLEENERLKKDPSAAVPEAVLRRSRQTIARAFRRRTFSSARYVGKRLLYVAALIVLMCVVLVTAAVAVLPNARETLLNLVVEVLDTNTKFVIGGEQEDVLILKARWLPFGFELSDFGNDSVSAWRTFTSGDSYVSICVYISENVAHSVDTENAYCEELTIQGLPAQYTDNGYEQHITISVEDGAKIIEVMSEGVSREDLIRVAENLSY